MEIHSKEIPVKEFPIIVFLGAIAFNLLVTILLCGIGFGYTFFGKDLVFVAVIVNLVGLAVIFQIGICLDLGNRP